jgi:adenylate cyclase
MPAKLKSMENDLEITLEDFNMIGRSPDANIRLLDGGVSRQHATIRRDGSLFWIADLGSANGSFVNDVAVTANRALRHGDHVQFGNISFIYDNDEESTQSSVQPASTQAIYTIALPVKTVKATLLVGDLRNFTALSAQLSAEEVASMLREWYAQCEQVLKSRGAVIDKFIGDGVFETRLKATEAAKILSGPEAGDSPKRKWLKEQMNLEVFCHIGLNIGDVALGAMGRGMSTAVGEAVNVTFRIESLTRQLKVPVLAGAPFLEGWPEGLSIYQNAGVHPVKGQPEPVEVYSLIDGPTPSL